MICDKDPTSLLPLNSSGSDVVFVVDEYSSLRRSVSTLSFYGWAGRHNVCLDLKKSAWFMQFDLMLCRGTSGHLTSSIAVIKGHCSQGLRLMHTNKAWLSSVVEVKQRDLGVFVERKPQLKKEVKLRSASG